MRTIPVVFVLLLLAGALRAQEKPTATPESDAAKEKMVERLNGIMLPQLITGDAKMKDIVEFLQGKAMEIEGMAKDRDPDLKPLKFTVKGNALAGKRITIHLLEIPLSEALRYTADAADTRLKVEADGVIFVSRGGFHGGGDTAPNASLLSPKIQEENRKLQAAKLNRIMLPNLDFREAHLIDVIYFLSGKSLEFDESQHKGVNFVLKGVANPSSGVPQAWNKKISLGITNISVGNALDYMAQLSCIKITIDPNAVVIEPGPKMQK